MASRSLLRRLAGLSPVEQDELLEGLVQQLSASLLGHGSPSAIDPGRDFLETGFDSLTAMELRNQLNNAAGLRLPPMAVFDNKNPATLARFVRAELTARLDADADHAPDSKQATEPPREPQTLSALFREAVNSGTIKKSFAMLAAVADVRPNFTSIADLDQVPVPVKLADGPNTPRLICIGSPMATGSPYQLARMASYFRGVRAVLALPLPGFTAGEMLPATPEATIEALTASALQAADGEPFVMVGYSAGGIFARVIARQIQQDYGVSPAGLVMLDSYRAEADGDDGESNRGLVMAMLEHESAAGGFDVARLSAMGHYVNIVPKLVPGTVDARVLFIQCTAPFGPSNGDAAQADTGWRAQPWDADATVTTIAANHFSILNTDAELPAQAIAKWLESWT
jgi:thioesterase domain-containing protein/aryl carrier-like protein